MNKKTILILGAVVVLVALGFVLSKTLDWPVDSGSASGNIAKSSRFSRKTTEINITNMEELLQSDPDYRSNIVLTYTVMQSRAAQFSTLVDMSVEAAGEIPAFAGVIADLKEAKPMVDNVCASLSAAGINLDTVLGGDACADVAQSTTNAALAYTTLQKQNKLADTFIKVADKYFAANEASDELKFARDQWVAYQQMTAVLDGDQKAAQALADKGSVLTAEQTAQALAACSQLARSSIISANAVLGMSGVNTKVIEAACSKDFDLGWVKGLRASTELETIGNTAMGDALQVAPMMPNGLFGGFMNTFVLANSSMNPMGDKVLSNVQEAFAEGVMNMIAGNIRNADVIGFDAANTELANNASALDLLNNIAMGESALQSVSGIGTELAANASAGSNLLNLNELGDALSAQMQTAMGDQFNMTVMSMSEAASGLNLN